MVKYHNQEYPADIPLRIEECTSHFDITAVSSDLRLSMHTEYSYGKRNFDSDVIWAFPAIIAAQKDGVPQLRKNEQWAKEFAQFISTLAGNAIPAVIEVHPPFVDYCTFDSFLASYRAFEAVISEKYPDVMILIENRCGSVYKGGKFLVSTLKDVECLCNLIVQNNLRLKVAYDVPQIYSAHNVTKPEKYMELLKATKPIRDQIGGVHLWGKRKSESGRLVSHCGDLNSYFAGDVDLKYHFLQAFRDCFDDGIARKMVLEVNSGNEDLLSIVQDLRDNQVLFV
jgi:hypothetical protein